MDLLNIDNKDLKFALENLDSSDLIKYIKTLDRKNKRLLLNNIRIILGKNYVNSIEFILSNRIKNNIIIGIITLFILLLDFIIYPLIEDITYYKMIKDNFILLAYLFPLFFLGSLDSFWIELIILFGMTISIILINKKRKIFPYIILYISLLIIHLFIGIIIFGIKNGE